MTSDILNIVEIVGLNDDLLLPWLGLYETAFSPSERVLVSFLLKLLKDKTHGLAQDPYLLAALDKQRTLVGIAMYELDRESETALLWYLAIVPENRSKGLGSIFYREILHRVDSSVRALLFEVEIPDESKSGEGRQFAQRRIQFYRRHGAFVLNGIHYMQHVGKHQPPIPMHIMVHPFQPITPQTAFKLTKSMFEDSITQIGPLALE